MKTKEFIQISIPQPCHEKWEVNGIEKKIECSICKRGILTLLLLTVFCTNIFAQKKKRTISKKKSVILSGHVIEVPSEKGLANIKIYLKSNILNTETITDSTGAFVFKIQPSLQKGNAIIFVLDKSNSPEPYYYQSLSESNRKITLAYPKVDSLTTVTITYTKNHTTIIEHQITKEQFDNKKLKEPIFLGGDSDLHNYFLNNIRYPERGLEMKCQGKIRVYFKINDDGSISQIEVQRRIGYDIDEKMAELIRRMPWWKPATFNGNVIPYLYFIQFNFVIEK